MWQHNTPQFSQMIYLMCLQEKSLTEVKNKMIKQLVDICCGPPVLGEGRKRKKNEKEKTKDKQKNETCTSAVRHIQNLRARVFWMFEENKIFFMPAVCSCFPYSCGCNTTRSEACREAACQCSDATAPKARHLCSLAPGSTDYQGCLEIKTKCNYLLAKGPQFSTCLEYFIQ